MSAPVQEPTLGQRAEEQVRRTVKALRSANDVSIRLMCERAGMSRGTYFSRMNGSTSFTAGEVAELADLFGVEIGDIYSGRITVGPTPPRDGGPTVVDGGSTTHRYVARKRHLIAVDDLLDASPSEDVEPAAARVPGVDDGPLSDAMALSPFVPGPSVLSLTTAVPA